MNLPEIITGNISFKVAKLEPNKTKIMKKNELIYNISPDKRNKKLIKFTTKFIYKLLKLHYDEARVYFNGEEFVVKKINTEIKGESYGK